MITEGDRRIEGASRADLSVIHVLLDVDDSESLVLLVFAEALAAGGHRDAARAAAADARARIEAVAARVADPALAAGISP